MTDSYPHALQAAIRDTLLARDAISAWTAVQKLAGAVRRSKVSLRDARTGLAVCLGSLNIALVAAGLDSYRRLRERQIARRLLAATSLDDVAEAFLAMACKALRPALLIALVDRDRGRLEAIARSRLHGPDGVRDVLQAVTAKLLDESESDPSEVLEERLASEVDREAHKHARRHQRRAGRSVPHDEVAAFLGSDPSQERAVTMQEVDETAARVLSAKDYAVYEMKRRGDKATEIAEALQISPRTVRDRWQRARKQLRKALGLEDPPPPGA